MGVASDPTSSVGGAVLTDTIAYFAAANKNVLFNRWHVRSTMRAQPICKVYFAKIKKIAFILQKICTYKKKAVPLHQFLKITFTNNKIFTIMRTLKLFKTKSVEIKLVMTNTKDSDFMKGIYKIIEKPRHKFKNWKEDIIYYDYCEDAKKDLINRINFWL